MKAKVVVTLKKGVHDPQGEATLGTLKHLGFGDVGAVRVGKYIELDLDGKTEEESRKEVDSMCRALLANPIIESYQVEIHDS